MLKLISLTILLLLQNNQYQSKDSQCIWTFDAKEQDLSISLNTGKNIIYSEFPRHDEKHEYKEDNFKDLLVIYIQVDKNKFIQFNPTIEPKLANNIWYYSGPAKWKSTEVVPESFIGYILYKECDDKNNCKDYKSFQFKYDKTWSFKEINDSKNKKTSPRSKSSNKTR